MNKKILLILEIILGLCVIGFTAMYFVQAGEYKRSSLEYTELSSYAVAGSGDETFSGRLKEAGIPDIRVDFNSLRAKNKDLTGWIYYPGLSISYPVVQGEDDEYYLHRTFEGEDNSSGCIFLESLSDPALTEFNTFLFGHNMKNGTMFGSLKRLVNEEGLFEKCKDFYYYTPVAFYRYSVYSYYITAPGSDTFYLNEDEEEYGKWQEMVLAQSVRDCGVETDPKVHTLSLSTCSGTGKNKKRLVVHGMRSAKVETGYEAPESSESDDGASVTR